MNIKSDDEISVDGKFAKREQRSRAVSRCGKSAVEFSFRSCAGEVYLCVVGIGWGRPLFCRK